MLSKILAIPLALAALILLYLTWEQDMYWAPYLVAPVVSLAVLYVFSPQVDWWWYQRFPPQLDPPIRKLFNSYSAFYHALDTKDKEKFRNRVGLYMQANEFSPMGMDEVPEDVKAVIAAQAVQLTFQQEAYLLNKFERIIVYPDAFPSPQFPEHRHSTEHFEEDGVLLFSARHLMAGFVNPTAYLPIGLYEYFRIYRLSYPEQPYPKAPENALDLVVQISGFQPKALQDWIGLPGVDLQAVLAVLYFTHASRFSALAPELFRGFGRVFSVSMDGGR